MLWLSIVVLVLTFIAVMLVSGNNLSACVGPAIGSRIISKRFGMLLGADGFFAGSSHPRHRNDKNCEYATAK